MRGAQERFSDGDLGCVVVVSITIMSVSQFEIEVQSSLRRFQNDPASIDVLSTDGDLDTIEMFHRLGQHCPLDLIAEAVARWLRPISLALGTAINARALDALVAIVLKATHATQSLRSTATAMEREARSAGGGVQVGELKVALTDLATQNATLRDELKALQLTHLEACEAFLVNAAAHQRQLEDRDARISGLLQQESELQQKLAAVEHEIHRMRQRLASESFSSKETMFQEVSRSNALRLAWDDSEQLVQELRRANQRLAAEQATIADRCELQLQEAVHRNALTIAFAMSAMECTAFDPFRRMASTVVKLRSVLSSQSTRR
jgi:hypothetical protein